MTLKTRSGINISKNRSDLASVTYQPYNQYNWTIINTSANVIKALQTIILIYLWLNKLS